MTTLRCYDPSPDDDGMTCSLLPGHVTEHVAVENDDLLNGKEIATWPNVTGLDECARAAAAAALTLLGGRDLSRLPEDVAADLRRASGSLSRAAGRPCPSCGGYLGPVSRWQEVPCRDACPTMTWPAALPRPFVVWDAYGEPIGPFPDAAAVDAYVNALSPEDREDKTAWSLHAPPSGSPTR